MIVAPVVVLNVFKPGRVAGIELKSVSYCRLILFLTVPANDVDDASYQARYADGEGDHYDPNSALTIKERR